MEELKEQENNRPWLYKKGQSGNPKGRPKGTFSLKTYVRQKLENMTDEEREEFLEGIDKKTLWEMSEGKPKQDLEANVKAQINITIPKQVAESFNIDESNPETIGGHTQ